MDLPVMNAANWENVMGSVLLVPADLAEDDERREADVPTP